MTFGQRVLAVRAATRPGQAAGTAAGHGGARYGRAERDIPDHRLEERDEGHAGHGQGLVCGPRRTPSAGRWSAGCPNPGPAAAFLLAGDIAWRRQGPGVQRLEANLRRVIGPQASGKELRALSRAGMRSYARYWLEVFRLPVISRERILADTVANGGEQAAFAKLAAGRGVVFALPHTGNWELAGAWIIARGAGKFTTVAERLKPESVFRRFLAFREGLGLEVLPATGGDSRFGVLAQRLRAGGLVCLPADRDVTGGGIEVEFFGAEGADDGRARPRWPCRPAPRCCRPCCGSRAAAGACTSTRRSRCPPREPGGRRSPP